jgi:hypothetical protein
MQQVDAQVDVSRIEQVVKQHHHDDNALDQGTVILGDVQHNNRFSPSCLPLVAMIDGRRMSHVVMQR